MDNTTNSGYTPTVVLSNIKVIHRDPSTENHNLILDGGYVLIGFHGDNVIQLIHTSKDNVFKAGSVIDNKCEEFILDRLGNTAESILTALFTGKIRV